MKDGFYWARFKNNPALFVVDVRKWYPQDNSQHVFPARNGRAVTLEKFELDAEFVSKEPLIPPEVS